MIGRLQEAHGYLRPVCFYSAYEAATSFVIGQRIAMRQSARIKQWLGEQIGDRPTVDGHEFVAFPRPARLLEVTVSAGSEREEGRLAARHLRARRMDGAPGHGGAARDAARGGLGALRALPGVGEFTAEAVWLRGCGVVDELPSSEEASLSAARELYGRPDLDRAGFGRIADAWRPFRMWATVLLRMGWNREAGPRSYRQGR